MYYLSIALIIYGAWTYGKRDRAKDTRHTLYRSSAFVEGMRIHVASFDADEKGTYNQENCQIAAELFQAQPKVITTFWCEVGEYKK